MARPAPPAPHTVRNVVIVVVLVVVVLALLAVVPVPRTNTMTIDNPGSLSTYYQTESLSPTGAPASVSFTVESGNSVTFSVIDPNGYTVWSDDASSGSTTFTIQTAGVYEFGAYDWNPETVDVTVTVTSPIL